MGRCFLSYSKLNFGWVSKLREHLRLFGVTVGWDDSAVAPGDDWVHVLETEVGSAETAVLVVTPESLASHWVLREIDGFRALDRPIFPVLASRTTLPAFITSQQLVDMSTPDAYEAGVRTLAVKLLDTAPGALASPATPITYPGSPTRLSWGALSRALKTVAQHCQTEDDRYVLSARYLRLPGNLSEWLAKTSPPELAAQSMLVRSAEKLLDLQQLKIIVGKMSPKVGASELERLLSDLKRYEDLKATRTEGFDSGRGPRDARVADVAERRAEYYKALASDWERTPLPLMCDGTTMPTVHVPLALTREGSGKRRRSVEEALPATLGEFLAAYDDVHLWEVVGEPGSGKTTLLREIASDIATRAEARVVPFYVPLAGAQDSVEDYLNRAALPYATELYRAAIADGNCLLLVDGLDEVDAEARRRIRLEAERIVSESPGSSVVVSSREVAFEHWAAWTRLALLPLRVEDRERLLAGVCGDPDRSRSILAEIEPEDRLQKLVTNPMTLTVIGVVAKEYDKLPRQRADLYDAAVHVLMTGKHGSGHHMTNATRAKTVLADAARELYGRETAETLKVEEIDGALAQVCTSWPSDWSSPEEFRRQIAEHTGLIQPTDSLGLRWRFIHRTFHEYLAACSIAQAPASSRQDLVRKLRDDPKWSEVLVLLTGMLREDEVDGHIATLATAAKEHRSVLAVRALGECPHKSVDTSTALTVLGLHDTDARRRQEVFFELCHQVKHPNDAVRAFDTYLVSRGQQVPRMDLYFIGKALRRMGTDLALKIDARRFAAFPDVPPELAQELREMTVDGRSLSYWCKVPAGRWQLGSDPFDGYRCANEPDPVDVELPEFEIGRTAITNAQYARFDPHKRRTAEDFRRLGGEHYPVVKITWFDAVCFAEWIATRGPEDLRGVHLPSEAEWEKAASWCPDGSKRRFPWGNDWKPRLANAARSHGGGIRPAAEFAQGASGCGAIQLSGNVCEWTTGVLRVPFGTPKFEDERNTSLYQGAGSITLVVKGGSWGDTESRCRTTARDSFAPTSLHDHVGFRLARTP